MKLLKFISSISLLLGLAGSLQAALVVNGATTGNLTSNGFNTSPVFTTDGGSLDSDERDQYNTRTLIQTFRVTSNFTLTGVVIEYQRTGAGTDYGNGDITLNLYSVEDTLQTPQTALNLGSVLKSWTFTSNATTRAAAGFTDSTTVTSLMKWTFTGSDTYDLTTSTSPGGYALQFTSPTMTTDARAFAWRRSATNVYAPGTRYDTVTDVSNTGNFALAVIPEPSTWALVAFSLTTVLALRRRRRA